VHNALDVRKQATGWFPNNWTSRLAAVSLRGQHCGEASTKLHMAPSWIGSLFANQTALCFALHHSEASY